MELFYKELINHGIQLIGTLLMAVIAPLLVKMLVMAINRIHNDTVRNMVWPLVLAAEKKFGVNSGEKKYQFVSDNLVRLFR